MLKQLTRRDRVAGGVGIAAVLLFLAVRFVVFPVLDRLPSGSVEAKELALRRARRLVATSQSEASNVKEADERLKSLEAGLLESPSASLANAEWQQTMRELADSKGVELGSTEFLAVHEIGPDYALVEGRVTLRCRVDQLVDLMAALATAPRLLSVTRLRIAPTQGDPQKKMNIEMTVAATMRAVRGPADTSGAANPK